LTESAYRIEKDSMGEVRVPADAKWRAQTQRAVENFPISFQPIDRDLIGALASIKGASAAIRGQRGMLDADTAKALETTAVPGDVGAIATLNSICNSKTKRGRTSAESTLHALEKPIR